MIIDAHQHFWDLKHSDVFDHAWLEVPEHGAIHRTFLPGDLQPVLERAGVERCVFVQTQHHREETRWAFTLAEHHDWIAGVVGWVDLASPECAEQVAEFRRHPKFCGVRHITQGEPDDDFIVRPDVVGGLKVLEKAGVPFDLLFYVKHLRHAATLGEMLPELPMVIDHLAKPRIRRPSGRVAEWQSGMGIDRLAKPHIEAGGLDDWKSNLRAAAKHENIYCKLSGMVTEADWQNWKPADLKPYVEIALDAFGPQRLIFGSDWPVCTLAGTYQQVFDALQECLAGLSATERDRIMGGTAAEFYRLKLS